MRETRLSSGPWRRTAVAEDADRLLVHRCPVDHHGPQVPHVDAAVLEGLDNHVLRLDTGGSARGEVTTNKKLDELPVEGDAGDQDCLHLREGRRGVEGAADLLEAPLQHDVDLLLARHVDRCAVVAEHRHCAEPHVGPLLEPMHDPGDGMDADVCVDAHLDDFVAEDPFRPTKRLPLRVVLAVPILDDIDDALLLVASLAVDGNVLPVQGVARGVLAVAVDVLRQPLQVHVLAACATPDAAEADLERLGDHVGVRDAAPLVARLRV